MTNNFGIPSGKTPSTRVISQANPLQASKDAFTKGMDMMSKTLGIGTDPALSFYQQLQPQDFTTIQNKWGKPGVINYIKSMESKRMSGGKNG
jgi:hypothetical protein